MVPPLRAAIIALLVARALPAQGVAGAALQGTVTAGAGTPLADVSVLAVNQSNGERWQTTTAAAGRFVLEHLSIGGPYSLEFRRVGYAPTARTGIILSLGQRLSVDVELAEVAVELQEIIVAGGRLLDAARTGPAQVITRETISRLPVNGRDISTLALLSPQVSLSAFGGLSFTGLHQRTNSLQIDGTNNTELFGVSGRGLGTVGSLAPEAIEEVQVLTAPFDVRFGNFAGGLVNAVSKSGSNRFAGSGFGYIESAGLTGRDTTGSRESAFNRKEFGLVLGGPILRDQVSFFVSTGGRRELIPQAVPAPSVDTRGGADVAGAGVRYESLARLQQILRDGYGVDPGDFSSSTIVLDPRNVFAKVTGQPGVNHRVEVSHNFLHFRDSRSAGIREFGFYELSSSGNDLTANVNVTRAQWTAAIGRGTNELIVGRLSSGDNCRARAQFPGVEVSADNGFIGAGVTPGCEEFSEGQTIWELTDNFTLPVGQHRLTFGTHGELLRLYTGGFLFDGGRWFFDSLDSLEQGLASGYLRDLPGPSAPEGPRADFRVRQIGFYAQDAWTLGKRLTLTAGVRVDVPFAATSPVPNVDLLADLAIDNTRTPSGNALWSPRLGMNYDLTADGRTVLRGGIGLFAGRPPYFAFAEVYRNSGVNLVRLQCFGSDAPTFTLVAGDQPTSCASGAPPMPLVAVFDPAFRHPRNLKLALGLDRRLPWGVLGTVDVVFTRGMNQHAVRDLNLLPPSGVAQGEGGRVLYGTVDLATGVASPDRRSAAFGPVIELYNRSGDRAWSLAGQLQKRFANGTELSLAYTYTDAKDRVSNPADFVFSNLALTPVDGSLEDRNLRTSYWSVPHKITALATLDLPLKLRFGLFYAGSSGPPLTYVVRGDANADGVGDPFSFRPNDPIYVPLGPGDITLADPSDYAALDRLIEEESCLRRQRGRLVQRNSCRDPWTSLTQMRLTKAIPTTGRQAIEISADLFNVLNFLDGDWGLVRRSAFIGTLQTFELVGYDEANGRGVYDLLDVSRRPIDVGLSRWRVQLSARYVF